MNILYIFVEYNFILVNMQMFVFEFKKIIYNNSLYLYSIFFFLLQNIYFF